MNYIVTLDDLIEIEKVYYYDNNGEEQLIGLTGDPHYEVTNNTITVISNNEIPVPRIDYKSSKTGINLGTVGAVDINSVTDGEGNNLEYTVNDDNTLTVSNLNVNDSVRVNYDLERIRIGALEYEDGDKSKNPTKYGMRIRNSQGEDVLTTDDNGDITMTGTIHAYAGDFTGTVNAQAGEFSGSVRVGSSDNYVALTTELEDGPAIASSDYVRDRNRGWAVTGDGNAIFNNITARGSIKTAVFEYQEIDAVGGAFLFRPSSTVRTASVDAMRHYITVDGAAEIDLSEYYPVKIEKVIVNGTEDTAATFDYDSMVLTPSLIGTTEITYVTADLWITVEKPAQFHDQEWVKLGVDPDGSAREMIAGAGLTAVYKLEKYIDPDMYTESGYIDESNEIEPQFILKRAGNDYYTEDMIIDEDESSLIFSDDSSELVYGLEGTALISFGYEDNYEGDLDNYGIGINSGAADLILPPRAISLFESRVKPKENVKVDFDYTGILGTLPSNLSDVNSNIYQNMENTQGIYTDNMYIGDESQYVAFYTTSDYTAITTYTYVLTSDTTVDSDKTYYSYDNTTTTYSVVTPVEGDNPNESGWYEITDVPVTNEWYELSGGTYSLSTDTSVNPSKTYYEFNRNKHLEIVGSSLNIALNDGENLKNIINADSSGTTINADQINTAGLIIGTETGVHIRASGNEIGFWVGEETNSDNKTAYINGRYLYIPYSVVLNEMEVGTKVVNEEEIPLWAWKKTSNENLRLVWLGGEV